MTSRSDAAAFLMAVGDADSDGITSEEVIDLLLTQLQPHEAIRLRVGCVALIAAIDKLQAGRLRRRVLDHTRPSSELGR